LLPTSSPKSASADGSSQVGYSGHRGAIFRFLVHLRYDPATLVGLVIVLVLVIVAIFAPMIAPYGANQNVGAMLAPPTWGHPFGTNVQGRDLFSRVVLGSRNSLGVAFPSVAIAVTVGLPLGMITGFVGGLFDSIFLRIFDRLFAFPAILLAITIVALFGPSVINLILTIGLLSIPRITMVVRTPVLSLKEREFVIAARMLGAGPVWTLREHILPNIMAPLIVETSLLLSTSLLTEAALSFLGLGIQPPDPSWGADLSKGREFMELGANQVLFPGLTIMIAVLGFNLLGDGLRDFLDPRSGRRRWVAGDEN
jgi:peptide/nickel transport system permease protein